MAFFMHVLKVNYCPLIIIIITICILQENNTFSMNASLPYSPPLNTDFDYYQTFFIIFRVFHIFLLQMHNAERQSR